MSIPHTCELGPIRPPSESASLLLRITRNCPWNRCAFCAAYKQAKPSRRSEDEIIAEIDLLAGLADRIRSRPGFTDDRGEPSSEVISSVIRDAASSEEESRVALWLLGGGKHVFLQDADSLIVPPDRICRILGHLKERFPSVDRVTTYARSRTLVARSESQLAELHAAGLTRIHVGVETGCDELLTLMNKGCRAEHHIEGLCKTIAAGFEVCCYVMPGLGGRQFTKSHAVETAKVLKAINPQHIRLRTLWIDAGSPLDEMHTSGQFDPLEEDEVVSEIQLMLRGLNGATSTVISDHDRNLLPEIQGHVTDDAERLDGICQRFLDRPPDVRDAFVLARRSGYVHALDDFLNNPAMVNAFTLPAAELRERGQGSLLKGMTLRLGQRSI